MIDWRQDGGLLTAWVDDALVATVYKDGCEWLVVGPGLASGFKKRGEAIGYVEKHHSGPDDELGAVGGGPGPGA